MQVLIVEHETALGQLWQAHLERQGHQVVLVGAQSTAISAIHMVMPDIIVLNLVLPRASALAIADYAAYRAPAARVIFVSNQSFFSDGSIFAHVGNACAFVPLAVPPEDLCAMVAHYGPTG